MCQMTRTLALIFDLDNIHHDWWYFNTEYRVLFAHLPPKNKQKPHTTSRLNVQLTKTKDSRRRRRRCRICVSACGRPAFFRSNYRRGVLVDDDHDDDGTGVACLRKLPNNEQRRKSSIGAGVQKEKYVVWASGFMVWRFRKSLFWGWRRCGKITVGVITHEVLKYGKRQVQSHCFGERAWWRWQCVCVKEWRIFNRC